MNSHNIFSKQIFGGTNIKHKVKELQELEASDQLTERSITKPSEVKTYEKTVSDSQMSLLGHSPDIFKAPTNMELVIIVETCGENLATSSKTKEFKSKRRWQ